MMTIFLWFFSASNYPFEIVQLKPNFISNTLRSCICCYFIFRLADKKIICDAVSVVLQLENVSTVITMIFRCICVLNGAQISTCPFLACSLHSDAICWCSYKTMWQRWLDYIRVALLGIPLLRLFLNITLIPQICIKIRQAYIILWHPFCLLNPEIQNW